MSKRILIISDSIFRQTGYSTVTNNIIKHLDPSFTVAQLGVSHMPVDYTGTTIQYYAPILNHSKCCNNELVIEHYDPESGVDYFKPTISLDKVKGTICKNGSPNPNDPYSFESAYFVIQHFKPDVVITINDIWGMYKLNFMKNRNNFKLISYLAVDSECFPVLIKNKDKINTMQFISGADKIVVFTDWAKETVNKTAKIAINQTFNNIEVIPHGVDNEKFFDAGCRDAVVQNFFKQDPKKVFIIGSVNRNQPRKRLDAIFQTLRVLIDKYEKPDGRKFMVHFHCAINDHHGWDLPWLATYYGVSDRVILDTQLKPGVGVPDEVLNQIMNGYDAHFVPTNSEGWGLSILETMACGVPNVISDYSAHGDWAKDHALLIKLAAKIHEPITNHIKGIIDIEHAAEQINELYTNFKVRKKFRKKSFELANKLQWGKICARWNALINGLDYSDLSDDRYDIRMLDSANILEFPDDPTSTEFVVQEI